MAAPTAPAPTPTSSYDSSSSSSSSQMPVGIPVDLPEMPEDARQIRRHITAAWKAYRGDWRGKMPLKVDAGDPDDNVLVNRCGPIVDKGVSFLFGEAPKLEVKSADGKHDGPKAAQAALDAALGDPDDFMTTMTMLAMNGGVAGHTFAKLLPAGAEQAHAGESDYPRIVVQDPQNYWVVTDPDDVNCALQYVCEYDMPAPRANYRITKRVVTAREAKGQDWTITTYVRERPALGESQSGIVANAGAGGGGWYQVDQEDWPHPWSPIHDCMNLPNPNEYWGISDITPDMIHLNSVLNYVQSNINKIGRLHGTPWTYAVGADPNAVRQVDGGPGKVTTFPDPNTKPGAVQWQGDIANLMAFAAAVRSDMDEQSRVPAVALGRLESLPKGDISGVALQLLFQPLIEKTTLKRRLYGKLVRELCEHILELCGFAGLCVHINWPNLLPVDDLAAAQTAQLLQQIGVSSDTLMQQLGYDPDVEQEKQAQADAKKLLNYSRGQGMPPATPLLAPPGGPNAPQPAPGQAQQQQQSPAQAANPPPVNHPAAIAARAAAKAAGAAMKGAQ